eukprot:3854382-Prymnesium_polylepis.1
MGNRSCLRASIKRHAGFDHVADVYYDNDALEMYAHQPEWMAIEALRFIRMVRQRQQAGSSSKVPFFLLMAATLTHSPADVAKQLKSAPRAAPAGCASEADKTAPKPSGFEAAAKALRSRLILRLQKAGFLCGAATKKAEADAADGAEVELCTDGKLPKPASVLKAEPWLPAEWFTGSDRTGQGWRSSLATSAIHAAWLDASFEPIVKDLKSNGDFDRTLIIFTADHGAFFAGKGHPYED